MLAHPADWPPSLIVVDPRSMHAQRPHTPSCTSLNTQRLWRADAACARRAQEFCAQFQRAETFYAYHWWLHKSDKIRVGDWEGADGQTRRMSYLVPYQAPRWFKRAVGAPPAARSLRSASPCCSPGYCPTPRRSCKQ